MKDAELDESTYPRHITPETTKVTRSVLIVAILFYKFTRTTNSTSSIMATQFVKWCKTKFHHHGHGHRHTGSGGRNANGNMLVGSSESSTGSGSGSEAGCSSSGSSSSDILLLASRSRHGHKCGYKTMSVLGSDTTSDGYVDTHRGLRGRTRPHSDTEDLVRDDASSLCHHDGLGLVNGGMVSSSSESSDFSHHDGDLPTSTQHQHECCSTGLKMANNLTSPLVNVNNINDSDNVNGNHHDEDEDGDEKFEDFECDVHLGGGGDDNGGAQDANADSGAQTGADGDKKEFSFTFYDLDGHGKITKDDIAGLVRSIYGAVNNSITVPQGGKKTIKVRLTVSPEQAGKGKTPEPAVADPNKINNNISHYEEILNATGSAALVGENEAASPESTEDNRQASPTSAVQLNKLRNHANLLKNHHRNSKVRFSSSAAGSPAKKKSNLDRFMKRNSMGSPPPNITDCEECQRQEQMSRVANSPEVLHDYSGGTPMKHRKKAWRERLSGCCRSNLPLAKPHLFELLQANMEKNNVSPCCRVDYSKLELQNNYRYQQQQYHSQQSSPVHHLCSHNRLLDPKCPILPLLNNSSSNVNNAASNNNNNNNTHYVNSNSTNANANAILNSSSNANRKSNRHHRSRSHDISQNLFNYQLLETATEQSINNNNNISKRSCSRSNSCKCNNVNMTANYQHHEESVEILTAGCCVQNSPKQNSANAKNTNNLSAAHHNHQLKHRNREQEHQRAMAQVINWLERENLGVVSSTSSSNDNNGHGSPRAKAAGHHHHHHQPKCHEDSSPNVVKKFHHHVHEHIHHHYHHYNGGRSKETPIIV